VLETQSEQPQARRRPQARLGCEPETVVLRGPIWNRRSGNPGVGRGAGFVSDCDRPPAEMIAA